MQICRKYRPIHESKACISLHISFAEFVSGPGAGLKSSVRADGSTRLSVKQLRLWPSSSFYLIADAVEESDCILLLVQTTELLHHISGPSFREANTHTQTHKLRIGVIKNICKHVGYVMQRK